MCPVCKGVAAARQVRPEPFAYLLDAATSFVAALRTVVAPVAEPDLLRRTSGVVEHVDPGQH